MWIQHEYDKKWWQYESNVKLTKDKSICFLHSLESGGAALILLLTNADLVHIIGSGRMCCPAGKNRF